jgi:nifR3 family TIM-barrel protein
MKIGNQEWGSPLFLAPMAGITDTSYREICRRFGADFVCTEMVSAKALYYGDWKSKRLMKIHQDEKPVSLQLFGEDPDILADVVKRFINTRDDIAVLDFNMGCPAPKIVKSGAGSALVQNLDRAQAAMRAIVKASEIPVSVKIRVGWDIGHRNGVEIAKRLEETGIDFLAVHGRSRAEFYQGKADWEEIAKIKAALTIPVVGNGDITSGEIALKRLEESGVDGLMIGRGAMGNPWIFQKIKAGLTGKAWTPPSLQERMTVAKGHLAGLIEHKGERTAVLEMRKHFGWYLKGCPYAAEYRVKSYEVTTQAQMEALIDNYLNHVKKTGRE